MHNATPSISAEFFSVALHCALRCTSIDLTPMRGRDMAEQICALKLWTKKWGFIWGIVMLNLLRKLD